MKKQKDGKLLLKTRREALKTMRTLLISLIIPGISVNRAKRVMKYRQNTLAESSENKGKIMPSTVRKSDEEWQKLLTPEQYRITRQAGTEKPFTGAYYHFKEEGVYRCVCCGAELFDSSSKFDSGTGWPSFWAPISRNAVKEIVDYSFLRKRTEVRCRRCDAHLGHVFKDGPAPTGLRYCINSVAMRFEAQKDR